MKKWFVLVVGVVCASLMSVSASSDPAQKKARLNPHEEVAFLQMIPAAAPFAGGGSSSSGAAGPAYRTVSVMSASRGGGASGGVRGSGGGEAGPLVVPQELYYQYRRRDGRLFELLEAAPLGSKIYEALIANDYRQVFDAIKADPLLVRTLIKISTNCLETVVSGQSKKIEAHHVSLLHFALFIECSLPIIKLLLDALSCDSRKDKIINFPVFFQSSYDATPLHFFTPFHAAFRAECKGEVYELVKPLAKRLEKDSWPSYHDDKIKVIELLIERGADVQAQASNGMTPLHCIAHMIVKNDEVVRKKWIALLISIRVKKGMMEDKDMYGVTPLDILKKGDIDVDDFVHICAYFRVPAEE